MDVGTISSIVIPAEEAVKELVSVLQATHRRPILRQAQDEDVFDIKGNLILSRPRRGRVEGLAIGFGPLTSNFFTSSFAGMTHWITVTAHHLHRRQASRSRERKHNAAFRAVSTR